MTIEKTKEAIKVMQAFVDGMVIQFLDRNQERWQDINPKTGQMASWDWCNKRYRIKPEPHYRPFKSAEEVMDAIKEHGDWVKLGNNAVTKIVFVDNNVIKLGNNNSMLYNDTTKWERLPFVFLDGTPFGKLVEE